MAHLGQNGVDLQERDFDILVGLFECRVMTLAHISDLYFEGRAEAAKKRVQKLKAAGYLRERKRRIGDPSVLHIGTRAFVELQESGRLERFPHINVADFEKRSDVSDLTLRHELEVMDVRTAFHRAVREYPYLTIEEFCTWPKLYQFTVYHNSLTHGRRELLIKPDGFIRIREKTFKGIFEHMFFLELDRSTESQEIIAQKAACYLDYYQSGGLAVRIGGPKADFKDYPFRVLMVFKNSDRRSNAAERLLRNTPPILTLVWVSTFAEISHSPLTNIWIRPKDHQPASEGGLRSWANSRERVAKSVPPKVRLFENAITKSKPPCKFIHTSDGTTPAL